MLYIIATPIGNLEDMTYRAVKVLSTCDYVLCEDTRHSQILLNHYNIHISCQSYHRFNEEKRLLKIISDLKEGKNIGLISDAGTPTLADPGYRLIQAVKKEKIPYTSVPGPSSLINALVLAGGFPENHDPIQFLGFFPKKEKEIEKFSLKMAFYPGISVAFLPPSVAKKVFTFFAKRFPNHELTLLREMTKIHEEILTLRAQDFIVLLDQKLFQGEMVLITGGFEAIDEDFSLPEMVEFFQRFFLLSEKEALEMSAKIKKIRKQEFYRQKNG